MSDIRKACPHFKGNVYMLKTSNLLMLSPTCKRQMRCRLERNLQLKHITFKNTFLKKNNTNNLQFMSICTNKISTQSLFYDVLLFYGCHRGFQAEAERVYGNFQWNFFLLFLDQTFNKTLIYN